MSVNSIQNSGPSYPSHPVEETSNTTAVQISSGEPIQTVDEEVPIVPDESSSTVTGGDIPLPSDAGSEPPADGDPAVRAAWLEQKLEQVEDLAELAEQLEYLAEEGDPRARELLEKLRAQMPSERQLENWQEELDSLADLLPDADLDGDGVLNKNDADLDGDSVTNEAELANGTNQYNTDTDGDGITDYGELWLKQHNYNYGWMDANNPDANHNGIIDGVELPSSIQVDNNGNPIKVGATPGTSTGSGDSSSTDATQTQSVSLQWGPPGDGATSVNAQSGSKTVPAGDDDVVINFSGGTAKVTTSDDGKDLLITTSRGTITVKDYQDRKVYFEGDLDGIETTNFNASNLKGVDTDNDGYADTGVHFASTIEASNVTNRYDPFNGSVPVDRSSTDEVVVYNASNASGTFEVPSEIDGQEVKVVSARVEGNDVIIEVKASVDGEPLKTFRLKGAKGQVESYRIKIKLSDNGQYFDGASLYASVSGGKGDDFIKIRGGRAFGGSGSDVLKSNDQHAMLDGGDGDDYIEGGTGSDQLIGGKGNDFIYSGAGADTDDLRGGEGNDVLIVENGTGGSHYKISGGEGSADMTNFAGRQDLTDVEISKMDDMDSFINSLAERVKEARGAEKAELLKALEETRNARNQGAATIADAAVMFLMRKESDRELTYGGQHEASFDSDLPPPSDSSATEEDDSSDRTA